MNTPVFFRSLRTTISACLLGCALILGGCAIYKPEVIQGNFVSREAAAQLQPGMSREAVVQVLGTPLLQDMFRSNRWDYVFTIKNRPGITPQQYGLTLFFEGDMLTRMEGAQTLPSETDFVHSISSQRPTRERTLQADPQTLQDFLERNRYTAPTTTSAAQ